MNEALNTVQVSLAVLITVITTLGGVIATMYIMQRKDKAGDMKTIVDMATNFTKVASNANDSMINSASAIRENTEATRRNTELLITLNTLVGNFKNQ